MNLHDRAGRGGVDIDAAVHGRKISQGKMKRMRAVKGVLAAAVVASSVGGRIHVSVGRNRPVNLRSAADGDDEFLGRDGDNRDVADRSFDRKIKNSVVGVVGGNGDPT